MKSGLESKIGSEKGGAMELKLMEDGTFVHVSSSIHVYTMTKPTLCTQWCFHLFVDSQFQIFNYPTGEAISVNDFPDYVKKKGTEAIETEYEVSIPHMSNIY